MIPRANTVYSFRIMTAGLVAEIVTEYRPAEFLYADFRTDKPFDFQIELTDDDLDMDIVETGTKRQIRIKTPCMLRKMAEKMIDFDTLLIHGAVLALHDQAYLFTAPSGIGKSTHVETWLKHCPDAYVINGDKPFLRFFDNGAAPLACGSPWAGKENAYTNVTVPLKSIIIMERADINHIEQISFAQAIPALLQQVYRSDNVEKMRKTLRLMQCLSPVVSFWRFQCNNFKDDCFDIAFNALVKDQK